MGAKPINPTGSLFVPESEYAQVEQQALAGSAAAAVRLERQYAMTAPELDERERTKKTDVVANPKW